MTNRHALTEAEEDLMRRLRQQRRDDWGLDLPDYVVPLRSTPQVQNGVIKAVMTAAPYALGIAAFVFSIVLGGW